MATGISEKQQRGRPFVKGQSGNPSGRPPGAEGLAAQIRAKTKNGLEMIELMIEVMRDTSRVAALTGVLRRPRGSLTAGSASPPRRSSMGA
jgi:hypothetical protein